jgi:ferredoxin
MDLEKLEKKDVYERLGEHLSRLGMGYPIREDLVEILKEIFTPEEAQVAMSIPSGVMPLQPVGVDEIMGPANLPRKELLDILDRLEEKGLLFVGKTEKGEKGYALLQVGFGFPQTFFWKGEDTPHARKMARAIGKYFNRKVTQEAYSTDTKPFRYIPIGETIEPNKQAVYSNHMMENVIEQAEVIALAHCPCRVAYSLCGKDCRHPTEVCMKFNDMARFVIDRGLAKEITKEEAHEVIALSVKSGLVHFVDNAEGHIQHNCNCCGCACWNVGNIRRRKIPRDQLMATYFIRETDEDECTECGECVSVCPVDALIRGDDVPIVDKDWCIGCGVCATVCPTEAVKIKNRPDKTGDLPASNFEELHQIILEEKGLK